MRKRMPDSPLTPKSLWILQCWATKRTRDSDWWILSWSTRKIHPASGSVSIVLLMCLQKSSSVRVVPTVGVITWPLAICQLAISATTPWRIYSNSMRSTRPSFIGWAGYALSKAWMPVFSSLLTKWIPLSSNSFAFRCREQMYLTCSLKATGSSGLAFNQYRWRWGCRVASF